MNKFSNISVAFWTFILTFLFVLTFPLAQVKGDGSEYLLSARAISEHFSPDIKQEDTGHVATLLDKSRPGFRQRINTLGKKKSLKNGVQYGGGFVRAPDGTLYSLHFWLYSAFVAPFLKVVDWLGLPWPYAFGLCNWLFVFGMLSYLALFWNASLLKKRVLATLFLLTGTTYYIWWTHPEVFTASLILLSLMMASDKRYKMAMISSALGATQNPPLIFLLGFVTLLAFLEEYNDKRGKLSIGSILKNSRKIIVAFVVAFGLASLPVIFFKCTLGMANPITAAGFTDMSLISLSRLQSLFLDLNLGMIVAAPGVLFGVIVLLANIIFSLKAKPFSEVLAQNKFLIFGLLLSLTMAIPALSTTNWDHGHSVFSRYAYWLAIPLVFGLVTSLESLSRHFRIVLSVVVISMQLLTVAYYGVWGKNWRSNHLSFKPIASFVLLHYPRLYNPIPAIFIKRLGEKAGAIHRLHKSNKVFIYPKRGTPTKILLVEEMAREVARNCHSIEVSNVEGNWSYINLDNKDKCVMEFLHQ